MARIHRDRDHSQLKIEKIAVFTDFSTDAEAALAYAAIFARRYDACLILAHAYVPPGSAFAAPSIKLAYEALEIHQKDLRSQLLAEVGAFHDLTCMTRLHEGSPSQLLGDLQDVDLIIIGTSGKTGLKKAALGSTAEMIFRSAQVPVLTVGPHCPHNGLEECGFDVVLYPTDFSATAAAAFPYALQLAQDYEAELVLLHVINKRDAHLSYEHSQLSAESLEELNRLIPAGSDFKGQPTCIVGSGTPDTVILEEVKKRNAGIVVIGAREVGSYGAVVSHFGRGTAYNLAAKADCPVFVVRGLERSQSKDDRD